MLFNLLFIVTEDTFCLFFFRSRGIFIKKQLTLDLFSPHISTFLFQFHVTAACVLLLTEGYVTPQVWPITKFCCVCFGKKLNS